VRFPIGKQRSSGFAASRIVHGLLAGLHTSLVVGVMLTSRIEATPAQTGQQGPTPGIEAAQGEADRLAPFTERRTVPCRKPSRSRQANHIIGLISADRSVTSMKGDKEIVDPSRSCCT